jgi:hypothetical protein
MKGKITRVGQILTDPNGLVLWQGWVIDGQNRDLAGIVYDDGEPRTMAGWSMAELHTVAHGEPCLEPGCRAESNHPAEAFRDMAIQR